jgi:hypothetical protein
MSWRQEVGEIVGNDAWNEPDTGTPPCDFCRRSIPCECDRETCMCTCGRCLAPEALEGSDGR